MNAIWTYLDEAVSLGLAKNDSDIARKLGIKAGTVCDWRKGRSAPGEDQAAALAKMLGKPEIVAECMAHRATRDETRKVWEVIAQMLHESEAQTKTARRDGEPSEGVVAWGGIEPPTRGFSIRCSTN